VFDFTFPLPPSLAGRDAVEIEVEARPAGRRNDGSVRMKPAVKRAPRDLRPVNEVLE
jgi:hypothetical protein